MSKQISLGNWAIETLKISLTLKNGKFKLFFKKPVSFAVNLGFEGVSALRLWDGRNATCHVDAMLKALSVMGEADFAAAG